MSYIDDFIDYLDRTNQKGFGEELFRYDQNQFFKRMAEYYKDESPSGVNFLDYCTILLSAEDDGPECDRIYSSSQFRSAGGTEIKPDTTIGQSSADDTKPDPATKFSGHV